jgi:hypothetical protein
MQVDGIIMFVTMSALKHMAAVRLMASVAASLALDTSEAEHALLLHSK